MENSLTSWRRWRGIHIWIGGMLWLTGVATTARADWDVDFTWHPTAQPAAVGTCLAGQPTTFTVSVSGSDIPASLSYTWFFAGGNRRYTNPAEYQFETPATTNTVMVKAWETGDAANSRIKSYSVPVTAGAFTVNILPSAGCTVTAADGGVDTVETPNGIVCTGTTAATDPLCTEQFQNSDLTALKAVADPGYTFLGWTVNDAQITLTSAEPLLLTTMPVLAGKTVPVTNNKAKVQANCAMVQINTDSNNDGTIDAQDDLVEDVSGRLIDYNQETEVAEVQLQFAPLTVNLPNYALKLDASSGGTHLKVWDSAAKTKELSFPQTYALDKLPAKVYVSGCKSSNCGPGEGKLTLSLYAPNAAKPACQDTVYVIVTDVAAIDGEFRIMGAEKVPYYEETHVAEVTEESTTFVRMLGGMRLHLQAVVRPGVSVVEYEWYTASTQGKFFNGYGLNATQLTGNALKGATLKDIYWESANQPPLDDTILLYLKIQQGPTVTTIVRSRKIGSRVLQVGLKGDDVTMLQTLINFFAWSNVSPLEVDGAFGGGTNRGVERILQQNYGRLIGDATTCLHTHFQDYRKALNDFGWNEGSTPDTQNALINGNRPEFKKDSATDSDGWVENAATYLTKLPSGIITPNPNWSTDKRELLLAVITQESGTEHWNNWKIKISDRGAIGFLQVMPFNSKRYNTLEGSPVIDSIFNVYQPNDNLKAAAQLLNAYVENAFSGDWTQSGDDQDDLLAKALACYNGGRPGILSTNSWETICTQTKMPLESLRFAVQIKQRLGLTIESFEESYK